MDLVRDTRDWFSSIIGPIGRMRRGARPNALRSGKLHGSIDKVEEEMPKLDGKIAVITGGSSGIGLATAKVFVKKGARVYITGRRQAELEATAALLGPRATPVQGDVAKPADLDRLCDQVVLMDRKW